MIPICSGKRFNFADGEPGLAKKISTKDVTSVHV